jgi:transposase-like protein
MASKKSIGVRSNPRRNRVFSDSFKLKKVRELELNQTRVCDICREYDVSSTAVYNWVDKFSVLKTQGVRQIVEPMSDTAKLKALREQIAELQKLLGQKQVEIEFKDKLIEVAEEMYGVDIKKKLGSTQSSGSGKTKTNTD